MKKNNETVLTKEQARELRFFCRNVVGTRQEFYKCLDQMLHFKYKIDRLKKTCDVIEKVLGEQITSLYRDESPHGEEMKKFVKNCKQSFEAGAK